MIQTRARLLAGAVVLLGAALFTSVAVRGDKGATPDGGASFVAHVVGRRRASSPRPQARALLQPTVAHPLTVLEIGDSLGEDLGYGLQTVLAGHHDVQLLTKAVGDSGLANTAFYDWPATFKQELATYHPGLVVVFIGGNDAQGFDAGGQPAVFGSAFWRRQYSARVATMMSEAKRARAQVLWVGMPIMESATFSNEMRQLNAIYKSEARRYPNVRYYSSWKLFSTSAGGYAAELAGPGGQLVEVRDPDGVHIAPPGGDDRIAGAVVKTIDADWSVRL